ncbi:uncharacterized protein EV420DRAFT_1494952, partial [Desarmillaria tabescens]
MNFTYPEIRIYDSEGRGAFDDSSPLESLQGLPEISPDIWDQGIMRGFDLEPSLWGFVESCHATHRIAPDPSQYLTSPAGDEGMLLGDGTSPYGLGYNYYLTPSNSLSPASPSIPLHTPEDMQYPLPQYSPVQFNQGSALLRQSFQSLHISADYSQPSSPTSSTIQPTTSNFPNTFPTDYDSLCLLSPISITESVALSPSPTTSVFSLPDEEQLDTGRGQNPLAGKRCPLPANAKRNLRSPPERSAVAQHRKKINTAKKEHVANGSEAKRIRERKYKCHHEGCTKTYTASHNYKGAVLFRHTSFCM